MIIPPDLTRKRRFIEPYLSNVGKSVRDTLLTYCEVNGFAFASRYKDLDSLAEKIETGRFRKWSTLNDLFACAIVVPTLQYEGQVLDFLESSFHAVEVKARGTAQKDPSTFGFDSTRFTGRLAQVEGLHNNLTDILFEVQIRSAFEHAWSVTTHALTYKGAQVDWRMIRLAAQLKASVEQLDNLILGFQDSAQVISEQEWPEIQAKKAIESFFSEQFTARLIPSECRPTNWTRFCENVLSMLTASHNSHTEEPEVIVEPAIDALRLEISELGLDGFPRSVSLLQFVLGALAKAGIVSAPLNQYTPLVTSELRVIYPQVNQFSGTFDFELADSG